MIKPLVDRYTFDGASLDRLGLGGGSVVVKKLRTEAKHVRPTLGSLK